MAYQEYASAYPVNYGAYDNSAAAYSYAVPVAPALSGSALAAGPQVALSGVNLAGVPQAGSLGYYGAGAASYGGVYNAGLSGYGQQAFVQPQFGAVYGAQQVPQQPQFQLDEQVLAEIETRLATLTRRRPPVLRRQIIKVPGPAGRVQQVVRRLPEPQPDLIERVYVVKPQRDVVNLLIERPGTPPPQVQERRVVGRQHRPVINQQVVRVAPRVQQQQVQVQQPVVQQQVAYVQPQVQYVQPQVQYAPAAYEAGYSASFDDSLAGYGGAAYGGYGASYVAPAGNAYYGAGYSNYAAQPALSGSVVGYQSYAAPYAGASYAAQPVYGSAVYAAQPAYGNAVGYGGYGYPPQGAAYY